MKHRNQMRIFYTTLFMSFILASTMLSAQESIPELSTPINIDEALKEPVAQNRATRYYYVALARWSELDGDLESALSRMKKALDYNSDSPDMHLELATLLGKMGRSQEAFSHAEQAARLNPKDPNPHWLMYRIYRNTRPTLNGEFEKAVRELEIIRELDPQNGDVYFDLGDAYFDLNEPEKAIAAFEKFQTLKPDSIIGFYKIAEYYKTIGDPEKAIVYLSKALASQPESIQILDALGTAYIELNRIRDAIPVYRKLVQIIGDNPNLPESQNLKQYLATLLYEGGEYREAGDLLEDILSETPGNIEARILQGRIQTDLNEYAEAIETFESINTVDPEIARRVEFHKGIAYKDNNEYSKAIEIFEKLLKDSPNNTEQDQKNHLLFQYHLISIYLKQGENEKAVSTAEQGYEQNPNNMRMGIFYAQTLADTGNPAAGIDVL
ncbi:MAG: tetratricopeptide repeat protein, partial [Acidobacteriota bacterium]